MAYRDMVFSSEERARLRQRIEDRVERVTESGCWIWMGAMNPNGYGAIGIGHQKTFFTHRVAYAAWCGDLVGDDCACHKCDVPACCNPNHLFKGTIKSNTHDMMMKGRDYRGVPKRGEEWPRSKLKDAEVANIKTQLRSGVQGSVLANRYGVDKTTISAIKTGKTWGHIA